jgi:hypothetical protein
MPGASLWWVELPEGGAKAVVGRVLEVGTKTTLRRVGFWANPLAQNNLLSEGTFSGFGQKVVYPETPWPTHPREERRAGPWG